MRKQKESRCFPANQNSYYTNNGYKKIGCIIRQNNLHFNSDKDAIMSIKIGLIFKI